jgi:hypothetical protein
MAVVFVFLVVSTTARARFTHARGGEVEQDPEYFEIAKRRIEAPLPLFGGILP